MANIWTAAGLSWCDTPTRRATNRSGARWRSIAPSRGDHRDMSAQNKSVLISGIGIAGPTLTYWLLECGFEPTVVERAPRLRTGGYVIDFWGLGYDIAERMGLLPALEREGYHMCELRFVDDRGQRVGGFGVDVFRELTGRRYLSIPRSGLGGLIYSRIEGRCATIFGDSIAGIRQGADGVQVEFERTPSRRFDLVIGADGLHSTVRALDFGNQNLFERYLGYVVAAFEVEGYRPRDEGVYVSYSVPASRRRASLCGVIAPCSSSCSRPTSLRRWSLMTRKATRPFCAMNWARPDGNTRTSWRRWTVTRSCTSTVSARSACAAGGRVGWRWWATPHSRLRSLPIRARPLP
jgi:2-polyprenyl-6-methoxyphenol hydroxylase-like FAD-dependent oxidoreductase